MKLNIDENPTTPAFYGVISIPTVNIYVNGELAKSIVGAQPASALRRDVQPFADLGSD